MRADGIYVALPPEQPRARTVSDVMVETMCAWGVTHVFGMVGHSNLGFADAMRAAEARGDLTFIGIRHEGAAAFAASAYGKLTGRLAACFAIAGPGSTNLLTGLYDAKVIDEARLVAEATGNAPPVNGAMILAAWRGDEAHASELIEATSEESARRRWTSNNYARSVLFNGLGRHDAALDAAWEAMQSDPIGYGTWLIPELAEAASRAGDRLRLGFAAEWISERTRVIRSAWLSGVEARVQAFLSEGEAADTLYRESIAHLSGTRARLELARTHLLYGEWLRRERRRIDAREQLRGALESFTSTGADAFARRTERELLRQQVSRPASARRRRSAS